MPLLALLYLSLHDRCRAWKGFDLVAMDRLHKNGFISDPVSKGWFAMLVKDPVSFATVLAAQVVEAANLCQPTSGAEP